MVVAAANDVLVADVVGAAANYDVDGVVVDAVADVDGVADNTAVNGVADGAARFDDSGGGRYWPIIGPDHNFLKDWPTVGPGDYLNENIEGTAAKTAMMLTDWPDIGPDRLPGKSLVQADR